MTTAFMLVQAASTSLPEDSFVYFIIEFLDSPAPYSPFSEYLLVLFILWLVARMHRHKRKTLDQQAQDVLDEKFAEGELSEKAYVKFRQDVRRRR